MNKPTIFIIGGNHPLVPFVIDELLSLYQDICTLVVFNTNTLQNQDNVVVLNYDTPLLDDLITHQPYIVLYFPDKVTDHNLLKNNSAKFIDTLQHIMEFNPAIPILYLSSDNVYGTTFVGKTEQDNIFPSNWEALSNIFHEQTAQFYHQQYGLNLIGFRIATVYGHGQGFVSQLIQSIENSEIIQLENQGQIFRDFVWIEDITKIIYYFVEQGFEYNVTGHEIYNISTGQSTDTLYLLQLLQHYLQREANVELLSEYSIIPSKFSNNSKILALLGSDFSFTTLEEGLEKITDKFVKK